MTRSGAALAFPTLGWGYKKPRLGAICLICLMWTNSSGASRSGSARSGWRRPRSLLVPSPLAPELDDAYRAGVLHGAVARAGTRGGSPIVEARGVDRSARGAETPNRKAQAIQRQGWNNGVYIPSISFDLRDRHPPA
jgi:hypothetical protein